MIITIDGPAGSGKSTTAKGVALKLGFDYLDTGAMYRAITYKALKNNISLKNSSSLSKLVDHTEIEFRKEKSKIQIILDGTEVTDFIRSPHVEQHVSLVSSYSEVREKMVILQRRIVQEMLTSPRANSELQTSRGVVCEGRDMGTVVFPEAEVKIFLDASSKTRAKRRQQEIREKGIELPLAQVEADLKRRDRFDSNREISPLKKAKDAIRLDSSELSIEEEIKKVIEIVRMRMGSVN